MLTVPVEFLQLFTQPPGEAIYFTLLVGLGFAVLMMAIGQRGQATADRAIRRYSLAALGALIAWLSLLVAMVVAIQRDIAFEAILPPLEAVASLLTMVFIGWVFVAGGGLKIVAHAFTVIVSLALVGFSIYAIPLWVGQSDVVFMLSNYGLLWLGVGLSLCAGLLILTIITARNTKDIPLKSLLLLILLAAYGYGFSRGLQGDLRVDDLGAIRMGYFASMLVLTVLVYRTVVDTLTHVAVNTQAMIEAEMWRRKREEKQKPEMPPQSEMPRPVVSPIERESVQLMRALGIMLEDSSPQTVPSQVIRAVIDVVKADIAVLLRLKDANYADVETGYDRFMTRHISGMAINLTDQPTLRNSIEKRTQRPLLIDRNENEIQDLFTRLDIDAVGPVHFQPMYREDTLIGVLLVAMPYSKRELVRAEEELLKAISVIASSLLELSYAAIEGLLMAEERAVQAMVSRVSLNQLENADVLKARQELQDSLSLAREQSAQLSKQVAELKLQLERERGRIADSLGESEESQYMTALDADQRRLQTERDELAARLKEAQAALKGALSTDDLTVYSDMLATLQAERDDLAAQRDMLRTEIETLRNQSGGLTHPEDINLLLERMREEKARLENEQIVLRERLSQAREQLRQVGVNVEQYGLAELIQQLGEERDALIRDNSALRQAMSQNGDAPVSDNDERLLVLQETLRNVAADREAALKQRDKTQREMADMREKVRALRLRWGELETEAKHAQARARALQEEKTILQSEILRLNNERSNLVNNRDRLSAENQALEMEREQLLARMAGDRSRVEVMGEAGVGSLTTMIADLTEQRENLEIELNQTRQQLAEVENQLAQREADLTQRQAKIRSDHPDNDELLMGLVQEFRTPMTSITGYVDLLLGESAGILGEMQRKFLQRVFTNVQRLDAMLDDLVKVTEIDTGTFNLLPVPVNIENLIEDTITHSANQFREKGLIVNIMIEDGLPPVHADRDALSQVIGQLLTNAYLVSPPDSEISIRVEHIPRAEINAVPTDSLFVSVEDRGGGTDPEDEARVFSRKYKAENPLIQGLGDTGVGLSIAKALVEAQGGQLWLETQRDIGNRFNILLPRINQRERITS